MIDVQLVVKLGIIGYGNQAIRLIAICKEIKNCNIAFIYHPTKSLDDPRSTTNFSDILSCHAVIIATPNNTHFKYIRKLIDHFDGFIFCEKPPCNSLKDLNYLKRL